MDKSLFEDCWFCLAIGIIVVAIVWTITKALQLFTGFMMFAWIFCIVFVVIQMVTR